MTTVFASGSLSIRRLHPLFLERLNTVVASGFSVVVGDADGADASIQEFFFQRGADNVTVYCTGEIPRNNVGQWPVEEVYSAAEPGSRAYFSTKDIAMAKVADYGLMIWDGKSTGTLSNVIELLNNERSSRVFINKEKKFITVSQAKDLRDLIGMMSLGARTRAERKIGLAAKVDAIAHKQYQLSM
jgi:hypothetical protein